MRHHRDHSHHHCGPSDRFSLHALWHAIGRHRHGPGGEHPFGGGRGGFGGFGGGDEGMPRGRKFSSEDLQLLLIALLAEEPRHGYELIKALAERTNGFYTPSPGMVYPALTYLEELGYATVELEGNRKRYSLSEAGREFLAANQERVDFMLEKIGHFARKMDSVRRAFSGEETAEQDGGDERWAPSLRAARHAIRSALRGKRDASLEEQRRIVAILERAVAEIEGEPADKSR